MVIDGTSPHFSVIGLSLYRLLLILTDLPVQYGYGLIVRRSAAHRRRDRTLFGRATIKAMRDTDKQAWDCAIHCIEYSFVHPSVRHQIRLSKRLETALSNTVSFDSLALRCRRTDQVQSSPMGNLMLYMWANAHIEQICI